MEMAVFHFVLTKLKSFELFERIENSFVCLVMCLLLYIDFTNLCAGTLCQFTLFQLPSLSILKAYIKKTSELYEKEKKMNQLLKKLELDLSKISV
jgi:hypothetical protein